MYFAVKIEADNDRNGNPRRGWLVYDQTGTYAAFVDEGYRGEQALRAEFSNVTVLTHVPTSASYYRTVKRDSERSS